MPEERPKGGAKGQPPQETVAVTEEKPEPATEAKRTTTEETRRDQVVAVPERKKNGAPQEPRPAAPAADQPKRGRATETPIILPPPPRTTEYVVTVDNRTNVPIKIERLDGKTGERKELSDAEYSAIFPTGRPRPTASRVTRSSAPMSGGTAEPSTQDAALMEAYYRGVADYIRAVTSLW